MTFTGSRFFLRVGRVAFNSATTTVIADSINRRIVVDDGGVVRVCEYSVTFHIVDTAVCNRTARCSSGRPRSRVRNIKPIANSLP